ncbi:3-hydroxyacyl-CoA dehydrogenase [Sulfuritalea sp.]|uniref:3-hydroxyacyl-CoA dehydrogenase n=1 Tax=Sulfuritalea sp. TaxID=2480090 RepID=UPI001AC8C577|nr:3-hydroxyacyl-CoA dehydrogenase [Sulfuritalea sp.]MBN8476367.1 3-hydroxyacyl-CoA dehydrogenase [Sulfuritalea sp.]
MKFDNSTFIVTGGASGLGEATVRRFHGAGANVVIADLNSERGEKLAAELGSRAAFARTDVTADADGQACVARALSAFGGLHGLVNCAGVGTPEKVLGKNGPQPLANFAKTIGINLIGTFNMLRLAADAISKGQPNAAGERGVIINTASVAAFDGQIGQPAYAASKAGVVGMTLPVARELARFGIRVCTIAPGLFYTPMMESLPAEVQDSLAKSVPFPPRLGRPDEYAQLAAHIVENEMLNGETIRLDGALRMAPK